jgi:hypothetical protein
MGKLSAYILGLTFALVVGFYYLSSLYSPLLNWLMPVFGTPLIFIVTFLYLLLGNPIRNPILLFALLILGVIIGISARKGSRAIGAGIFVYGSLWGFIGSSIAAIIFNETNSGNLTSLSTSSLPPVPKGSSLTQIMAEPLIGRIASSIESLISKSTVSKTSTGGIPTNINFQGIIYEFLPFLILNMLIILITAGVVGMLIHKKTKGKETPKETEDANIVANKTGTITAIFTILLALMLIGSIIPATGSFQGSHEEVGTISVLNDFPSLNMIQSSNSSITTMNISSAYVAGSIVSQSGDLFDLFGGYSSVNSAQAPWEYNNQNLFTLEFIGDNLSNLFNSLGVSNGIRESIIKGISGSPYAGLIPDGMIMSVYNGNLSSTSGFASSQIKELSSSGVGPFVKILGISTSNLTIDNSLIGGRTLSFYLYGFTPKVYRAENSLYSQITNLTGNNSPMQVLGAGLKDGYLIPGSSVDSVNSSVYIAGYINYPEILVKLAQSVGVQSSTHKPVVFMGGIFEKNGVAYSSSTHHVFNLASTMNYNNPIALNPGAYNAIFIGSPSITHANETYNFMLFANQNIKNNTLNGNIQFENISGLEHINPDGVTVSSNYQFPAKILFRTSVISLGHGNFKIVSKMKNIDSNQIYNITVDENNVYSGYTNEINLTGGKPYAIHPSDLGTNNSIYVNYSIQIKSPGVYTFESPQVTYTMNGTNYNFTAPAFIIKNNDQSFVGSVNTIWLSEFSLIAKFTGSNAIIKEIFPNFYVFDLIPLFLILLDIYIEVRAFRKWRKK